MTLSLSRFWRFLLYGLGGLLLLLLVLTSVLALIVVTTGGSRRIAELVIDRVNQIPGTRLEIREIDGNLLRGLELGQIQFSNDAINLSSETVVTQWNPYSLLSGSVVVSELLIDQLAVELMEGDPDPGETSTTDLSNLQIPAIPVGIDINQLQITQAVITTGGEQYRVQRLESSVDFFLNQLDLQRFVVEADALLIDGQLQLGLTAGLPHNLELNWQYREVLLDPLQFYSGSLNLEGDMSNTRLNHELQEPFQISSSGQLVDLLVAEERVLDLTHTAASLDLPYPVVEEMNFSDVTLVTRVEDITVNLDLQSRGELAPYPSMAVSINGVLQNQSLNIIELQLSDGEASLNSSGRLDWSDGVSVTFDYLLSVPDPASFIEADLPTAITSLSSDGSISFREGDDGRQLSLVTNSLTANINNFPAQADVNIGLDNETITINRLEIVTNENRLELTGSVSENLALEWEVFTPSISEFLPEFDGALTGSGTAAGTVSAPEISGRLEASNLVAEGLSLASLTAEFSGSRNSLQANLNADLIQIQQDGLDQQIDSVSFDVSGTLEEHTFNAAIQSELADLDFALNGGFVDLAAGQWQGELVAGRLDSQLGSWLMQTSSALTVSREVITLEENCWNRLQASFCIGLQPQEPGIFSLAAGLEGFSFTEFNADSATSPDAMTLPALPRLPEELALQGFLNVSVNGTIGPGEETDFEFSAEANEFGLTVSRAEETRFVSDDNELANSIQQYNWEQLLVTGGYRNGDLILRTRASLSESNLEGAGVALGGEIESELSLDAAQMISGSASANFQNLSWLEVLVPDMSAVSGSLQATLNLSGSLGEPILEGELNTADLSLTLERFGITLDDIVANISGQSDGNAQVSASVRSGEGGLLLEGTLSDAFLNTRKLSASLAGNDFLLTELPDLRLAVSPQIQLQGTSESINLSGSVDVPLLDLTIQELPVSAVDVSRDVVVVSFPTDRPDLARSISASQATLFDIPVVAEVQLNFGDQVSFRGFGLEAALTGGLDIQQLAGGGNLTYGELVIESGSYQTYGTELEISQGKLIFFGAYDNPALDVRAIRVVDEVTVGVLMNGTIKNITSQLFSTPTLADNDIIAMLVTGRPFSQMGSQDGDAVMGTIARLGLERGENLTSQVRDRLGLDTLELTSTGDINNSMLTVGKYLSPRVFIRYGVGLFDTQSKVTVDYELSERIKLEAESGEYQSVDLTYRVER